jgi:L-aspartate oxidase
VSAAGLAPDGQPFPSPGPALATRLAAPEPGWMVTAEVIVVGSGIAGLTAALRLRRRVGRVLLVTKTVLDSGSTRWAQGGIAAALDPEDSPAEHLADTLVAGGGLCDEAAVRALVTEGPARVRELVALGANFDLTPGGDIALTREGGHHRDRIAHAGGDATGAEISRALIAALQAVRDDPGIEVIENAVVLDVMTSGPAEAGGAACGVTLHVIGEGTRDGVGAALGRAVVLATGGIGQVFQSTTNPREATGDGVAAALRAGAAVADLEFVQFHPTVLWLGQGARGQQTLISEAVRGEGALLLDVNGVRFMPAVHEMAELAPRDVVAKAIVRQLAATGSDHVFLDARHLGREFLRHRFPTIVAALAAHGFDPAEDLIPVAPAQHYHSGGILVDRRGHSSLPGLYAVGECSCTGVHGANRLASNSLLEGLVFAHRIADDLTTRLAAGELRQQIPVIRTGQEALLPATARRAVQRAASTGPGVIRTRDGLIQAAQVLASLPGDTHLDAGQARPGTAEWETTNLHLLATALTRSALIRTETRGGHYREDYPQAGDLWRGRLISHLDAGGTLHTRFAPLTGADPDGPEGEQTQPPESQLERSERVR